MQYAFFQTPFGSMLAAAIHKQICWTSFGPKGDISELQKQYPKQHFKEDHAAISVLLNPLKNFPFSEAVKRIPLHLQGSDFQKNVWKALQRIPVGQTVSYQDMACRIGRPKAYRAVGTAIGQNAISLLIPCHRVVRLSGDLGGYRWGLPTKEKLLHWEQEENPFFSFT